MKVLHEAFEMRSNLVLTFILVLVQVLVVGDLYAASVEPPNRFDDGETHGWTAGLESALPSQQPDGGPNGDGDGFLQVNAQGGNGPASIVATFNDDTVWTGDYAAAGITGLTVDLMNARSTDLSIRLVLFGPETTNNRWTSTEAAIVPGDGEWRNYTFPVSATDLTGVRGTATYDDVIQNVIRLMLRHDVGTPSRGGTSALGTLGIDNIAFLGGVSLDCNGDGIVDANDLTCANSAGITADLLDELNLLAGDFDGQGGVAFPDFLALSANFGSETNNYSDGDIDGDGIVAFADFLVLSANFGQTATLAAVPEPNGIAMLSAGLLSLTQLSLRTSKRSVDGKKI